MFDIDRKIKELDDVLCENIDLIDFKSRAFVSQNLLQHTRNLLEYVAIKAYDNVEIFMFLWYYVFSESNSNKLNLRNAL